MNLRTNFEKFETKLLFVKKNKKKNQMKNTSLLKLIFYI